MKPLVEVLPDPDAVAARAAELMLDWSLAQVSNGCRFTVALSGGSTPERLYRMLAESPYAGTLPWANMDFYWGDERNVPLGAEQSNYRMAHEALLARVPVPPENVHRVRTEIGTPAQVAAEYDERLAGVGALDLVLLGMGDDGHTASLFPGTAALGEQERRFVENHVPQLDTWRYTVTQHVLLHAKRVLLLVTGAGKAEMLQKVLEGGGDPPFPVELVNQRGLPTTWLLDEAAGAKVTLP